jgi:hypothetical protein
VHLLALKGIRQARVDGISANHAIMFFTDVARTAGPMGERT